MSLRQGCKLGKVMPEITRKFEELKESLSQWNNKLVERMKTSIFSISFLRMNQGRLSDWATVPSQTTSGKFYDMETKDENILPSQTTSCVLTPTIRPLDFSPTIPWLHFCLAYILTIYDPPRTTHSCTARQHLVRHHFWHLLFQGLMEPAFGPIWFWRRRKI